MASEGRKGLRTWIEIDRKAIKHNFCVFKSLISKKTKLMAVVKSNAYGHGLVDFAKEMEKLGADYLGVDSVTEALALRQSGLKLPILILGYTLKDMIKSAVDADVALTVSNFETLEALANLTTSKQAKIHIKVDTGMNRQGFLAEDLPKILSKLNAKRFTLKASVEGLYTHFASVKNPSFPRDTKRQIANFKIWTDAFKNAGFKTINHAAATAGALLFPESHFDMVRIGIGLYGLWPAKEVEAFYAGKIFLKPALSWKTIVSEIKNIKAGSRVGYDLTEAMSRDSKIAVCPVGYWHGFPRALSSIGRVIIRGKSAKVLGRISMDMIIVDVTGISKAVVEDEAVLIGKSGSEKFSAEDFARLSDASWYEVITRLNPLIKRIYI